MYEMLALHVLVPSIESILAVFGVRHLEGMTQNVQGYATTSLLLPQQVVVMTCDGPDFCKFKHLIRHFSEAFYLHRMCNPKNWGLK